MKRRSWFLVRVHTPLVCALFVGQSAFCATSPPPASSTTTTKATPATTTTGGAAPAAGGGPGRVRVSGGDGERPSNDSNWVPWAIGLGAIATALAIASHAKERGAVVSDQNLLANGPRFPDSYAVGVFAVQGYVASSWPVVVDFLSKPGTCTTLEISVAQKLEFGDIIDWDGRRGRQLIKIVLPAGKSRRTALLPTRNEARVAMYVIHSRSPACGEAGPQTPEAIEVYGIGAGERAVGSVAIDNLQFGPSRPRFPKEQVAIGYEAKSAFNHASVEILRYDQTTPGVITVQRVKTRRTDPVQLGTNSGEAWNGTGDTGARSIGVHRLQVRGWFTENDKSWVGAISPTSVQVAP